MFAISIILITCKTVAQVCDGLMPDGKVNPSDAANELIADYPPLDDNCRQLLNSVLGSTVSTEIVVVLLGKGFAPMPVHVHAADGTPS